MKVNDDVIDKLADLSKLEFEKREKEDIKQDLNNILLFIEKLQSINTENTEPLIYMNEDTNVVRKDVESNTITKEEALKNAPLKDSDYFKVPTVLQKSNKSD